MENVDTILIIVSSLAAIFSGTTGLLTAKIWQRLGSLDGHVSGLGHAVDDLKTRVGRLEQAAMENHK